MSLPGGKPDVVELARAQLDFGAMNTAAPSAKDILFKAQTIVPMAPRIPWEKYAAAAAGCLAVAAVLALPWIPRQQALSIAGAQFDVLLKPAEAQELVDRVVNGMNKPGSEALLSADYAPQGAGGGLLMLKAAAFGERGAQLQQRLAEALASGSPAPAYATYQVADYAQAYRVSPFELLRESLAADPDEDAARHPAAKLAASVAAGEALLRRELASDLAKHGHVLSGFAFTGDSPLLPEGCQFTVAAWPRPVAVGVRGYLKMASYQQREVRQLVEAWLKRMNLRDSGLQLAGVAAQRMLVAEVLDRQGRPDGLLTARLNAALKQPTPEEQLDPGFSLDKALSDAAASVLPGIERRVDIERVSKLGAPPRYAARVQLLGRAVPEAVSAPDPVEDTSVREEW